MKRALAATFAAVVLGLAAAVNLTGPATLIEWKPGMTLEPGHTYGLRGGVSVPVNVRDVTLVGLGPVWPAGGSAISVQAGGDDCRIRELVFDVGRDLLPTDSLQPAVTSIAKRTSIDHCTFDRVHAGIRLMVGSEDAVISFCHGTRNVRGGFIYGGGARRATIVQTTGERSITENLVRFSPETGVIPEQIVVAFSDLRNEGIKPALELRTVDRATVVYNTFTAPANRTALGLGRKSLADGPGATFLTATDNDFYGGGSIGIDAGAAFVTVERNTPHWTTRPVNTFVTVDGKAGTLHDVTLCDNVGQSTVPQKPLVSYTNGERIPGLIDLRNGWTIVPPATQPTTQPIK